MSARTAVEQPRADGTRHAGQAPGQQWYGWGSPVGLGVGLLCVSGFFVLLALGLSILDAIG